jgi:hypothetical protein
VKWSQRNRHAARFSIFDVKSDAEGIRLLITAPEVTRDAADLLFGHFAPSGAKAH